MQNQSQTNNMTVESVMNFIKQIVREKYGNQAEVHFVNQEVSKIYNEFGNNLVAYFKPMISDQEKLKLDKLINQSVDHEVFLAFLMDSIVNFEQKIVKFLIKFRENYIKSSTNK